jgi:hypothetical protein
MPPRVVPGVLDTLNHAAKVECPKMLIPLAHFLCLHNLLSSLFHLVVIVL